MHNMGIGGAASSFLNTGALGNAQGGLANAYPTAEPTAPRTIASAVSKLDGLNERLHHIRVRLEQMADTIGGPRPVHGSPVKDNPPPPNSIVHRLNDGTESAHQQIGDIESVLGAIEHSLA